MNRLSALYFAAGSSLLLTIVYSMKLTRRCEPQGDRKWEFFGGKSSEARREYRWVSPLMGTLLLYELVVCRSSRFLPLSMTTLDNGGYCSVTLPQTG